VSPERWWEGGIGLDAGKCGFVATERVGLAIFFSFDYSCCVWYWAEARPRRGGVERGLAQPTLGTQLMFGD